MAGAQRRKRRQPPARRHVGELLATFAENETVYTPRLSLGPLTPERLTLMQPWLEAALAPEWSLGDFDEALERGHGSAIADVEGTDIGVALVALDRVTEGDATLSFLAIDPARRFRGLGGEAGIALERHLRSTLGIQRSYAPVPEGRGLAVYFWLRLGFRPLSRAGAPAVPLGLTTESLPGIWMLRDA